MKKHSKAIAILSMLTTFCPLATSQEGDPAKPEPTVFDSTFEKGERWWVPPVELEVKGVSYQIFMSESAGQEVGYLEYLPPAYESNPDRHFPVLFWLHGAGGNPSDTQYVLRRFGNLIEEGKIPPMIVIGCNGLGNSWYIDSEDGRYPVETVLAKDLVKHNDLLRRTIPHREARVIAGFSMGGYGSMRIGLGSHETFATTIPMASGRYDRQAGTIGLLKDLGLPEKKPDDQLARRIRGGPKRWHSAEHVAINSAIELLITNRDRIKKDGLRIWMITGAEEWHTEGATLFGQVMEKKGIPFKHTIVPQAGHNQRKQLDYVEEEMNALFSKLFGKEQLEALALNE